VAAVVAVTRADVGYRVADDELLDLPAHAPDNRRRPDPRRR
jgi:hypothetical protein